jgi:hypothetical protein
MSSDSRRPPAEARTIALDARLGRELGEAAVILAKVAMGQGRWRQQFADELAASMRMRANMEPIVYDAHLCLAEYYLTGPDGYDTAADFAREMMGIAERANSATGRRSRSCCWARRNCSAVMLMKRRSTSGRRPRPTTNRALSPARHSRDSAWQKRR